MPEIIDNPFFLYADDTKVNGKWFDLSSIQTDLNNVITWASENSIDFIFDKMKKLGFKNQTSDL